MTQPALDTDEQLSGRAADAVADMHGELQRRYSGLNTAEAQLAEALLTAQTTSEEGRRRLQDIQRQSGHTGAHRQPGLTGVGGISGHRHTQPLGQQSRARLIH